MSLTGADGKTRKKRHWLTVLHISALTCLNYKFITHATFVVAATFVSLIRIAPIFCCHHQAPLAISVIGAFLLSTLPSRSIAILKAFFWLLIRSIEETGQYVSRRNGEFHANDHPLYCCCLHLLQNWNLCRIAHGVIYCRQNITGGDLCSVQSADLALVEISKG